MKKFGKLLALLAVLLLAGSLVAGSVVAKPGENKGKNSGKGQVDEAEMLKSVDIKELYLSVNTYVEKHPKATEEQINRYTLSQIRRLYIKSTKESDISPQISYYGYKLNPEEEQLFWENPWKAIQAVYYGVIEATDETEERFGFSGHNDASDAFRHAYWNALMVVHIDYNWAYRWATAHEEGAEGQPEIEKEMDLWNNRVGRLIAASNPGASDSELSDDVMEALNNGELRKIFNDELVPTP